MNKDRAFFKSRLEREQQTFLYLQEKAVLAKGENRRLFLAQKAVRFALDHSTGIYASAELENIFLESACKHTIPLPASFASRSVLHVMTETYATGGHTRAAERWIENSASFMGKQSLCLTENEHQQIPQRLKQAVSSCKGSITFLPDVCSLVEKGLRLRKLAAKYEFVVLHIHMHDPVPLIAFGTPDFKRPVFFFNHADHRFWLGVSISDKVVNFRNWAEELNMCARGVTRQAHLSLPIDTLALSPATGAKEGASSRAGFQLSENKFLIVTAGNAFKYEPLLHWDFKAAVQELLSHFPQVVLIGVGLKQVSFSTELEKAFPEKFFAWDHLPPARLKELLACSDLTLDSFPMSGATMLLDALTQGSPLLSLACPTGQSDYITNSDAYCPNLQIWLKKAKELILSKQARQYNVANLRNLLQRENNLLNWQNQLKMLYSSIPEHTVQLFTVPSFRSFTDLDIFLYKSSSEKLITVWGLYFYIEKTDMTKRYNFVLFNRFRLSFTIWRKKYIKMYFIM